MSNPSIALENDNAGWFALKVRHQNEFSVSDFFQKQFNVRVAVPAREVWKRRNGLKVAVTKPLLSAYVFVEASMDDVESKILFSHKGVLGFIRNNGELALIPNEQVASLEKLARSEAPVYEVPYSKLKEGERVQVVGGPLAGAIGNFVRISSDTGRFIVSLDLFRRSLVTELELDLLEPY
jgi:transcription antitermination factor NusG